MSRGVSRAMTRRELVGSAALLGAGLGAVSGASKAIAASPSADAGLLVDVLRAELLLAFSYRQALQSTVLTSRARALLERLLAQEDAHVAALTAALKRLGGTPPAGPADLSSANRQVAAHHVNVDIARLADEGGWFYLLLDLEHVVEGAYYAALAKLADPQLQTIASQILANEAQHEVALIRLHHPGDIKLIVASSLVQGTK